MWRLSVSLYRSALGKQHRVWGGRTFWEMSSRRSRTDEDGLQSGDRDDDSNVPAFERSDCNAGRPSPLRGVEWKHEGGRWRWEVLSLRRWEVGSHHEFSAAQVVGRLITFSWVSYGGATEECLLPSPCVDGHRRLCLLDHPASQQLQCYHTPSMAQAHSTARQAALSWPHDLAWTR